MTVKFMNLPPRSKSFENKISDEFIVTEICLCGHTDLEHNFEFPNHCQKCICTDFKIITKMTLGQYVDLENAWLIRHKKLKQRRLLKYLENEFVPINFRAFIFYNYLTYKLIHTNRLLRPFKIFYYNFMNLKDYAL